MSVADTLPSEGLAWWAAYSDWRGAFAEALDPRFYVIDHLDALVWSGRAKMFCDDDAAIIAELVRYPSGAIVVEGVIAAGRLDAIKALIDEAIEWGRDHGAAFAKIESREGWARALRNEGWEPFQTALVKEL